MESNLTHPETAEPVNPQKKGVWKAVLAILLVLLALGNVWQFSRNSRLQQEYTDLDKKYSEEMFMLNSITLNRFYKMMETGESFIVNVSRPNCGTCRGFEPEFLEILARNDMMEDIYYLNVLELRKDADAWAAFKKTFQIGGTPSYLAIKDGELLSSAGWTEEDGLDGGEIEAWLVAQRAAISVSG